MTRGKVKSKTDENKARRVIGTQIEVTRQVYIQEKFRILTAVLDRVGFMIITDVNLNIHEIIGIETDKLMNYSEGVSLEKYLKRPIIDD